MQGSRDIEAVDTLTPVQQGMLFHALTAERGGVYLLQLSARVEGSLDPQALRAALADVMARHDMLRSSFHWQELERPTRVVHRHVEPPLDLREAVVDADGARAIEAAERARGFALDRPPLVRLAAVPLAASGDDRVAHRLIFTFHHLVLDGWSIGIVLRELFTAYGERAAGRVPRWPRVRPFVAYGEWLRARDQGESAERAETFWRRRLAGFDLPTRLAEPAASATPQATTGVAPPVVGELSAAASAELDALARRRRMTPASCVQAAWAVLLARHARARDVVFGATVAGRPADLRGVETMVGPFLNTLPVRVDVPDDRPIGELLDSLHHARLEQEPYDWTPPDRVERWAGREAGDPLFDHALVYESFPIERGTGAGSLRLAAVDMVEATHYALTVLVLPGERLGVRLLYDPRRLARATVERLRDHVLRLLAAIAAADPERSVGTLDMLGPVERRRVLSAPNPQPEPRLAPVAGTLHGPILDAAARWPQRIAVEADATGPGAEAPTLTFGELAERSAILAAALLDRGIGPDRRVGVLLERGLGLSVALLAVLRAGGAYVPFDPSYPARRLALLADDSAVDVLLTEARCRDRLPTTLADRAIEIDAVLDEVAGSDAVAADRRLAAAPRPTPDALAYVIYTSGSTGRPKGAMLTHRGIAARLEWMQDAYRLDADDVVLQKTPIGFDVSVWELFWSLRVGARLVMARPGGHQDTGYLVEAIRRYRVTTIHFVPSMLRAWVEEPTLDRLAVPTGEASLRRIVASGEALPAALVRRLAERLPNVELHNLYGPTEASVDVSHWRCDPSSDTVPIGRPVANTRLHVIDRHGRPAPVGVAGELLIGGVQLARGYLDRPALTAERFVPDPFAAETAETLGVEPGARLYRTGDLARRRADGAIEYLGRLDHQVKIRGVRIELGEIEAALADHPAVREAAVAVQETTNGSRLVAYVVGDVERAALREFLGERLPDAMVPAAWIALDALPTTANGKLDRRALPAPSTDEVGVAAAEHVPPSTAEERLLARLIGELLGVERVGLDDGFFALGGDSIQSIQLASRARSAGLDLSPRDVLERPVLRDLAAGVTRRARPTIDQGPVVGAVPLSPIARLVLARRPPQPHHDNQAVLLVPTRRLELDALREAVAALEVHHDALRLRARRRGDTWQQRLLPPTAESPPPVDAIDAATEPLADACARLQAGLDLYRGPIHRLALIDGVSAEADATDGGAAGDQRLLWVIHHLAIDGVSWRILLDDLERTLDRIERGEAIELPPKTSSVRAWAERLEARAAERSEAADQATFWRALPMPTPLPVDGRDAAPERDVVGAVSTCRTTLDDAVTGRLVETSGALGLGVQAAVLATLARVLAPVLDGAPLAVDLEGHGRGLDIEELDTTRTVGWLTSLFPFVVDAAGQSAVDDLARVDRALAAVPDGGLGFGRLAGTGYAEDPGSDGDRPLAPVLFNYLGRLDASFADSTRFTRAPESPGPRRDPSTPRGHGLEINAWIEGGRLCAEWLHGPRHAAASVAAWADALGERLGRLAETLADGAEARYPLAGLAAEALATLDELVPRPAEHPLEAVVETVWPLAPLQRGIFFHALYEPVGEAYFEQIACRMDGALDPAALRRLCADTLARHPALRAAFVHRGLDQPVQVIHRPDAVELPWHEEDWRDRTTTADDIERFLVEDRRRGFALDRAPLCRVHLLRVDERSWVFVWSYHHLLFDGWSLARLLGELFEALDGGGFGQPAPPSFAAYLDWLADRDGAADEAFWRRRLAGFEAPTLLVEPTADGRQPGPRGRSSETLSASLSTALRSSARRHGTTVATLVQAAWALVLQRHAAVGGREVVFGATVSGRPAELDGVESIVGVFINTLPVRLATPSSCRLGDWIGDVHRALIAMRDHAHTPLETVHGWSDLPADAPLFDHVVVIENYPRGAGWSGARPGQLDITDVRRFERSNYPLALVVSPAGERFEIEWITDAERCPGPFVARLERHLIAALQWLAEASDSARLRDLDVLSAGERHHLLRAWRETDETPCGPTVPERIAEHARVRPEALAVVDATRSVDYRTLRRHALAVAARLRALGVGHESRVAVCLPGSVEWVVALLGAFEAGAATVALDPTHPPDRLLELVRDAGAVAVLSDDTYEAIFTPAAVEAAAFLDIARLVASDAAAGEADALEPLGASASPDPEHLAYVVYTSGSTGRPKGVAVPHRGLSHLVDWHIGAYGVVPGDRCAQVASPAFDAAVWELWPCLAAGATLEIPPADTRLDPTGLVRWWLDRGIRVGFLPTPLAEAALDQPWDGGVSLDGPRVLLTGGDRLRRRPPADLPLHLVNHYGPTESSVVATAGPVPARDDEALADGDRLPSIGQPIDDVRVAIVDPELRPVPVGVVGELVIGGIALARGYLGRPGHTAAAFVPDPNGSGERIYRTGDLVRWREDGAIDFVGRADHQVQIRGFRVELGEIEARLASFPEVDSVVVVADGEGVAARLIAYVVSAAGVDEGEDQRAERLRAALAREQPAYMVPRVYVFLDRLPLTANGKIDRRHLPAPPEREAATRVEATGVEALIAEVFADVLGLDGVAADDEFFALGGHSLQATRVITRVAEVFSIDLPIRALFEHPTPASLAAVVDAARGATTALSSPRVGEADEPAPLSFAQERMAFLHRLAAEGGGVGDAIYNVPVALRLRGALDVDALERALIEVTRRHDVLRTAFDDRAGHWVARVETPPSAGWLRLVELDGDDDGARAAASRRHLESELARPFDLAAPPLVRAVVQRFSSARDEHVLVLVLHHLVVDAWSVGVLLGETATLYGDAVAGRAPSLAEVGRGKTLRYADYAAWQRRTLTGDVLDAELDFWRRRLAGAPELQLPNDRPRVAGAARTRQLTVRLSPDLLERLRALGRERSCTLFVTALTLFQTLLHRDSGQHDVVVGTPVANRSRPELQRLVGLFLNTVMVRTDVSGEPSFHQMLDRVRDAVLEALDHQEVPFDAVLRALGAAGAAPLRAMFVLLEPPTLPSPAGLDLARVDLGEAAAGTEATGAKFDLAIELAAGPDGLIGRLGYDASLFDDATMQVWVRRFEALAAAVVERPTRAIATLPLPERPRPVTPPPTPVVGRGGAAAASPPSATATDDPRASTRQRLAERRAALARRRGQLSAEQRERLNRRLGGNAQEER